MEPGAEFFAGQTAPDMVNTSWVAFPALVAISKPNGFAMVGWFNWTPG